MSKLHPPVPADAVDSFDMRESCSYCHKTKWGRWFRSLWTAYVEPAGWSRIWSPACEQNGTRTKTWIISSLLEEQQDCVCLLRRAGAGVDADGRVFMWLQHANGALKGHVTTAGESGWGSTCAFALPLSVSGMCKWNRPQVSVSRCVTGSALCSFVCGASLKVCFYLLPASS